MPLPQQPQQSQSVFDPRLFATSSLLPQQVSPTAPVSPIYQSGSGLIVPDTFTGERLNHFPEDIYNLSDTSHLVRFIRAMLGPSGVGQLRSRYLITQLASTLSGSSFFDLDRFYGAIFGAIRLRHEIVIDPTNSVATQAEWAQYLAADASYREKILQLAAAIPKAGTVFGIQAAAEAVTGVDCDVYEIWQDIDAANIEVGPPRLPPSDINDPNLRTWSALQDTYPTWNDINNIATYQHLGNPTLSLAEPEAPLGLPVTYSRLYSNVEQDYPAYSYIEVDTWADVQGGTGTGGGGGGGGSPLALSTLVTDSLNVRLTWNTSVGAVGYELTRDGQSVFTTGPAGTTPATVLVYYDTNLAPGPHTWQVIPYTAYDATSGVRTYGTPSATITLVLLPPNQSGSLALAPEDRNNRSLFVVRPKKTYSSDLAQTEEEYALGRVLQRLKPAGTLARVSNQGVGLLSKLYVANLASDSEYWEVTTKVVPKLSLTTPLDAIYPLSQRQQQTGVEVTDTREIPKPVNTQPQTTEWSYNSQVVKMTSYAEAQPGVVLDTEDYETVLFRGDQTRAYTPDKALMNAQLATAARYAGDGTIAAAPYSQTRTSVNG